MTVHKLRKFTLLTAMLLFPVTIYYMSPYLIFQAAFQSAVNGSFILFCLMTVLSVPFGRIFCAFLCPAGAVQECAAQVTEKPAKRRKLYVLKYVIWAVWLSAVTVCYVINGIDRIDPFFMTEHGISVSRIQDYIIYYGIIILVVIPAMTGGKRAFCHYFCWMAPFMAAGTVLRRKIGLRGLAVAVKNDGCVSCGKCSKNCPMSIDVMEEIGHGSVKSLECIQCGECIEGCPKKVLGYGMIKAERSTERKDKNGK